MRLERSRKPKTTEVLKGGFKGDFRGIYTEILRCLQIGKLRIFSPLKMAN